MNQKSNEENKLANIREELNKQYHKKTDHVGEIKQFSEFNIIPNDEGRMGFSEDNICIVPIQQQKEKGNVTVYEIYDTDTMEKIAFVDEKGKLTLEPSYIERLQKLMGEKFPQLQLTGENKKDIYLTVIQKENIELMLTSGKKPEEIQAMIKKDGIEAIEEKKQFSKQKEELDISLIGQDLKEDGIESEVTQVCDISDAQFYNDNPTMRQYHGFGNYVRFVYLKDGTGMFVGMKDGKYEQVAGMGKSRQTMQTANNISADGTKIEEDSLSGIISVPSKDNKMAYGFHIEKDDMGTMGKVKVLKLRRNEETGRYDIGTELETRGRYPQKERSEDVKEMMNQHQNPDMLDEGKKIDQYKEEGEEEKLSVKRIKDGEDNVLTIDDAYEIVTEEIEERGVSVTDEIKQAVRTYLKDAEEMGRDLGEVLTECAGYIIKQEELKKEQQELDQGRKQ